MASTTNYNWSTPDDTALVKDGAAAIRTLGSSIDTTTKALNPSTTLGDIEYRSSTANTNTRLGIGSTGDVLTVSGGVPTWAAAASGGGMTLISTTTLSGASVTLSSIPSTYVNLQLFFENMTNNTADGVLRIAPNGGTDYAYANTISNGTVGAYGPSYIRNITNLARTESANSITVTIFNYAMDDFVPFTLNGGIRLASSYQGETVSGYTYTATGSGISSLVITNSGGTWSGGTVALYGVK
jgi:hypothetical protein